MSAPLDHARGRHENRRVMSRSRPIPPFADEHEVFRARARAFVAAELAPKAPEYEQAEWFPNEVFLRCGEEGYLGLKYEERYGGTGGGYLADAVWTEELARCGSGGLSASLGAHTSIATPPIWKFGSEEVKRRYLVPAIRGEKVGALGITEPDAGSDVAGIRTRAERVEGGFVVNGEKTFITNGVRADFIVTAVKTTGDGGHHGLSFLVVDRGEGVTSSKLRKLGWHASDTATIAFADVFVPDEHLLGELNRGFYLIMANLQWERLLMALGAVGGMAGLLERLVAHMRGDGVSQAKRHRVAEIAVALEAGRDLTYHALRLFAAGQDAVREVTMAKLATQRAAFHAADAALDLVGDEPDLARAARDTRLGPIGGGTDEIMKEILGKSLGL
ncbi:MAG TPA: acyl-CoA dehydrogenase family protein [Solirubrobacteraceae bacterium]|nr:acyl-CoA dehydrogenase family protein [Solirubrobacteraceae bacterium]